MATKGGKKSKRVAAVGKGFAKHPPTVPVAPGSSPQSDAEAGPWRALRSWLEARGAAVDAAEVGVTDAASGLRGVVAARDIRRGEEIMSVPRDTCILDEARADASPVGVLWANDPRPVPACVRVGLLVLWLQRTDPSWGPALAMLPSRADFEAEGGPMELWSPEEVSACACAQLSRTVARRRAELRELYDQRLAPAWARAAAEPGSPLAGVPEPTFDEVQWATVCVSSRAYGEGEAGAGRSSMLVPGVDLCNHADPSRTNTAKGLSPWGAFVVLAARDIRQGEEVCITYGPMPNRLLLQQFGFMLPAAAADVAVADLAPAVVGPGPDGHEEEGGAWLADAPEAVCEALEGLAKDKLLIRDSVGEVSRWQPCGRNLETALGCLQGAGAHLGYRELLRAQLATLEAAGAGYEGARGKDATPRQRLAADFRTLSKRLLDAELARLSADSS